MRKLKKALALMAALSLTLGSTMTSFAGQWMKDDIGYWWQEDDGSYPADTFKWIDANGDTFAEGYYFDENGYVYDCTALPVSMTLDEYLYAQMPSKPAEQVHHNEGYDPAHPLAGKIDEWNLRLPYDSIGPKYISDPSLQALLTGQMEYYNSLDIANHAPLVDGMYVTEKNGTTFHVSEQDYFTGKQMEQQLYDWFCNWLNSMDFENMTEMEKAIEIQKVMAPIKWKSGGNYTGDAIIDALINKEASCGDCAMTATSLAKALGLKSAVNGTGNHVVYYIQVDGVAYFGQNNDLVLDFPTPDAVYFLD